MEEFEYRFEPEDFIKPVKPYGENIQDILKMIDGKKTKLIVRQISKPKVYNLMEVK